MDWQDGPNRISACAGVNVSSPSAVAAFANSTAQQAHAMGYDGLLFDIETAGAGW